MSNAALVTDKHRSVALLVLAQVLGMSVWFSSSVLLVADPAYADAGAGKSGLFASSVQIGFTAGAFASALFRLPDRLQPQRFFAATAVLAALANESLILFAPGSTAAILSRVLCGAALAGVYPVGMQLAASWGEKDRGLLVGLLVGALTLGAAIPHFVSFAGTLDGGLVIHVTSAMAALAALAISGVQTGPHYRRATEFRPSVAFHIWTDQRLRLVTIGYLGHMWELYAMWAWLAAALAAAQGFADGWSTGVTALAIGAGTLGCIAGGVMGDRLGRAETTAVAMVLSGASALLVAILFPMGLFVLAPIVIFWGFWVVADSAQFSAATADFADPGEVGTLLTMQTCQGFLLTFLTVALMPIFVDAFGWRLSLAALAIGPAIGAAAMWRLRAL